jgi:transglutaminase-like putative cysteine protease
MLVGAIALERASGAPALAALVALFVVGAALVGPRWELDRGRQIVASALGGGVGWALSALLYEERGGALGEWWTRLAAGLLLAAAARLVQERPGGGPAGTVILAVAAFIAIGETQGRGPYALFVALFLAASVAAMRAGEPGSRPLARGGVEPLLVGLAIATIAGALGAGAVVSVRVAHAWMLRRAQTAQLFWRVQTGFSDRMELGALERMLDSDTVVLRVRGRPVDYLRGAVFDVYENGRWMRSEDVEIESDVVASDGHEPGERTEIRAVSERVDRFFLPLEARSLRFQPAARADGLGVLKRAPKIGAPVVDFVVGRRDEAIPADPAPIDLALSRSARGALTKLAREWTGGAATTEQKLDALEHHLARDYRYAKSFTRAATVDPVMDFLFADRSGHCEYFATALALLSRSLGIPARVATGYRVAEYNRWGGYHVVRERHAHAWVEAWIEGRGWTTRDPTPASALPEDQPHDAGALAMAADVLRTTYDDATDWLARRTLGETALATMVGFVVLLFIIGRGARRRRGEKIEVPVDEAALPFLAELLASLERAGLPGHAPSEPLERLAARVPDPGAAELLLRYAALRYGGVGDAKVLAGEMVAAAARMRQRR